MGQLLNYADQMDEVVRLVQVENYTILEAIRIVKERSVKNGL